MFMFSQLGAAAEGDDQEEGSEAHEGIGGRFGNCQQGAEDTRILEREGIEQSLCRGGHCVDVEAAADSGFQGLVVNREGRGATGGGGVTRPGCKTRIASTSDVHLNALGQELAVCDISVEVTLEGDVVGVRGGEGAGAAEPCAPQGAGLARAAPGCRGCRFALPCLRRWGDRGGR